MPERDIRKALKERVESYGGEVRAVSWLGRAHAPDVLCLFPAYSRYSMRQCRDIWDGPKDTPEGAHIFIETKAPGGKPNDGQEREHTRLIASGCRVIVISTFKQLDNWLAPL